MTLKELPKGSKFHFFHRDGSHYVTLRGVEGDLYMGDTPKGGEILLARNPDLPVKKFGECWYTLSREDFHPEQVRAIKNCKETCCDY